MANWVFMGPTNLPPPYRIYYGQGNNIGRVNDIAIDPRNANTLYIATATGGIWKSQDGGLNWTPLSDNWPSLATSSVAVHPKLNNLVFAGTGDWDGGYPYTLGLMQSIPRWDTDTHGPLKAIVGQPPNMLRPPSGCEFHPRCPFVLDKCRTECPPLAAAIHGGKKACWVAVDAIAAASEVPR